MSDLAIRVDNVGKRYRIGTRDRYQTLRDVLAHAVKRPFLAMQALGCKGQRESTDSAFWALRNVSFEVEQGQLLGFIGRNGAGKSTLLKILSRITEPSEGRVEGYGRVGSLLEVGTGFHPELTGRENIYLNGAILGMTRAEINRKFDEIVAFAEIDRFLDTPVKRYSSGMYMRLAFAVAAHLEPEILMVDEVLAVGDSAFQKKCLGKMGDVTKEGRTVLFVSHNMAAMQSLCDRVIWLDQGRVVEDGNTDQVVSRYLQTSYSSVTAQNWPDRRTAPGNDKVRLHSVCVLPVDGSPADPITVQTAFQLEIKYWNLQPGAHLNISLHVYNEQGIMVFNAVPSEETIWQGRPFPAGLFRDVCFIPAKLMNDGRYRIELLIVQDDTNIIYQYDDILVFDVLDVVEGRGGWYGKWPGTVRPALAWKTELIESTKISAPPTNETA